MVLYLPDENNNITAEAEVDLKAKNIAGDREAFRYGREEM